MSMDGHGTKRRRKIVENFNRLSRVHERYRQTTDGRATACSEREGEFTFAKNHTPKLHEFFCTVLVLIVVVAMTTMRVMYFRFCG